MGLRTKVLELEGAPYDETQVKASRKAGGFLQRLKELSNLIHSTFESEPTEKEKDPLSDWEAEALGDNENIDIEQIEEQSETSYKELNVSSEDYLALIDMSREIIKSTSFEEYFENLMYSILGQYGVESTLIFTNLNLEDEPLKIVNYDGLEIEEDLILDPNSKIYKFLALKKTVIAVDEEFKNGLDEYERSIVTISGAAEIIPVFLDGYLFTIIFVGPMISEEPFSEQDIAFISIFMDFAGDYFRNVVQFEEKNKTLHTLTGIARSNLDAFTISEKISESKNLNDFFTYVSEYLDTVTPFTKYTILYQDPSNKDIYRTLESNTLSQKSCNQLILKRDTSQLLQVLPEGEFNLFPLDNFSEWQEIKAAIEDEDIEKLDEFTLVPFWEKNDLLGLLVLHTALQTSEDLDLDGFTKAIKLSSTILAKLLMEMEKLELEKNPFHIIEDLLDAEIALANKHQSQFSMLIIKIQNINRIINLLGHEFFQSYNEQLWQIIANNAEQSDHISKVGQGKYTVLLSGIGKKKAELFINRIKSGTLSIENPHKSFNISIQIYLLIYPEQTADRRKFLEMLEET